jgi:hypothetical protein
MEKDLCNVGRDIAGNENLQMDKIYGREENI